VAATALGGAVTTAVALGVGDGSPSSRPVRALVVVLLTALVVVALRRRSTTQVAAGALAVTAGMTGLAIGAGVGVWHVAHGSWALVGIAGLVTLGAGCWLTAGGSRLLWQAMPRWARAAVPVALLAALLLLVAPATLALAATNGPHADLGTATPAGRGLAYVDAAFRTSDGVRLSGWYLPSRNGAAVALLHGASSTRTAVIDQAEVLARHGYGVLLFDARGHGESAGRAMDLGWYGDLDTAAAVSFLARRPDVDPARIGAVGMSMGGEEAIGAAAADPRVRAVVAEGATGRTRAARGWLPTHWRGRLQRVIDTVTFELTDLLTEAAPPTALRDAVRRTAPRPVLLIAAGASPGGSEPSADRWIRTGSPGTVAVWVVPGSGHTQGLRTRPLQWEQRVVGFLDRGLD
jgi:dienelactone hydrolase